MQFNDNYTLKLLYSLAEKQPFKQAASHVIPEAKFNPSYPKLLDQKFVLTTIHQHKK
jgi:hypothetical protein